MCSSVGSRHMQFRHLLLSLALAMIRIGPLPARADAPAANDVATIGDCLRKQNNKKGGSQEADEAACLMTVAKPCMGGDETGVSSMRQIECLDRERLVWDKIINDSYKTMMNALEPDQQAKLREMQRSPPGPGRAPFTHPAYRARCRHSEPLRRRTPRRACFNRRNQPLTQIFRQGFRHARWPPRPADNMNQISSPMGIPIDSIRPDFALELMRWWLLSR